MSEARLAERTVKVAKELDGLLARALSLEADGDRVPYFVRSSVVFDVVQNTTGEMVFNIPTDAHFYGRRINLFLASRIRSTVDPALTDLTFRPVDWTTAGLVLAGGGVINPQDVLANSVFHISDSVRGEYQRVPIAIMSAFSTRVVNPNAVLANTEMPIAAFIGGLDFHTDYVLRKGSTMTVRITPAFSFGPAPVVAGDVLEFRVTGIFQGFKKAKALR